MGFSVCNERAGHSPRKGAKCTAPEPRVAVWGAGGRPGAVFYGFKAIKLTKSPGRGGYLPVSVLVLPGLALGNGAKRAFSMCQVEPNPVLAIYIRDSS